MKTAHDATGVEVFGREGCARCVELGRALAAAGVAYVKRDVETVEGQALALHYDLPEALPQVVVDGVWLDTGKCEPVVVAMGLAARQRQRQTARGPQIAQMNTDRNGGGNCVERQTAGGGA